MRSAYVYVIGSDGGPVKIGVASSPEKRVKLLQTGNHVTLCVLFNVQVPYKDARQIESQAHWLVRHARISGEWFDLTCNAAASAISQAIHDVATNFKRPRKQQAQTYVPMLPSDLVRWRKYMKLTQLKASRLIGCGRTSLQQWEQGANPVPKYIALACGLLAASAN